MNSTDFPYPYTLKTSARAKRMWLGVAPHQGIVLTVPQSTSPEDVNLFLTKHIVWIEKHRAVWQEAHTIKAPPNTIHLAALTTTGATTWIVNYEILSSKRTTLIEGVDNTLIYCGPDNDPEKFKKLRQWVHKKAASFLAQRIALLSVQAELPFNALSFRTQRSLWGSCTHKKDISLNYKLIFVAPHLVDYVLLHELAHTRYLNHSAHFWNFLSQFYPHYQQARKELKHAEKNIPQWFY
jgi:predicted metal-dependent hydrolase